MKIKTQQSVAKRLRITKKGKIIKRKSGQNHFNAREIGKVSRNKKSDLTLSKTMQKAVKELMPYA